jgi:signal transduction histidine kinase/ActR/RegA family two-component response regulator
VSGQRNRELSEQIARMARQQAALVRLARRGLPDAAGIDEAMREVTREASRTIEVERASVWLLSPDRQELRLVTLFEASPERHSRGVVLLATEYPGYFEALESGRAIDAHDASSDPRTSEFRDGYLEPLGISSMLDAAIRDGGRVIGVVCHEHIGAPRTWTGDEIAFAGAVGDQVALILSVADRLRLEQERERMRIELIHTQKLESIGTLAAGVVHEISNPLAYIATNLEYIGGRLDRLDDPAIVREIRRATREATLGADRVRRIVGDLTRFARRDQNPPAPVDVRSVLDTAISIAWNEIRHRARLVRDYGALALVLADADRLVQVFLNLLLNAAQAMEDGRAERNHIRLGTRIDGDRLAIEVQDTGIGIPSEALDRVFDPFFTTKPAGAGTGLGLSICHTIVTALGGTIEVESEVGFGTLFRVVLPVHRETAPGREPLRRSIGANRRARILLVDDEPYFINAMCRVLEGVYEVVGLTSAREALTRLEQGDGAATSFDLILCDLMMLEMSGIDMHGELVRRSPELARRVVFMTGGAFTPRARAFLHAIPNRCVEKPLDLETIGDLIREQDALPAAAGTDEGARN